MDSLPSTDSVVPKPSAGLATVDEAGVESAVAEMDMLDVGGLELDAAAEEEIEIVIQCLNEIAKVLSNPDNVMVSCLVDM